MKYHLYKEENCKSVRKVLVQGRYKNKTTKFGDSSLQSEVVEYVWKTKGNGKDNARTRKCVSLSKGGSWTSLVGSLLRPRGIHGENNQTSKGGTNDSNWSVEASTTNQHRFGGYRCGKPG